MKTQQEIIIEAAEMFHEVAERYISAIMDGSGNDIKKEYAEAELNFMWELTREKREAKK